MRKLSQRGAARRPRRRRDRGAAAIIVAVLFAGGAALGCAAFTVDLGSWNGVRRQMQNASDAVATSVATLCAKDVTKCNTYGANQSSNVGSATVNSLIGASTGYPGQAQSASLRATYVASDGTRGICGWAIPSSTLSGGVPLPSCTRPDPADPATPLLQCPKPPAYLYNDAAIPYIEAYTEARFHPSSLAR